MTTPLSDPENVKMEVVDDARYDVATGYALFADAVLPPVLRGDDLDE